MLVLFVQEVVTHFILTTSWTYSTMVEIETISREGNVEYILQEVARLFECIKVYGLLSV